MISRRAFAALPLACLRRGFSTVSAELEYIALDLQTGRRTIQWRSPESPVSMGSLLKPFLVVAFGRTHTTFPTLVCRGSRDRCWLPNGHGRQTITGALSNSCNCYFLQLASDIDRSALNAVCLTYSLRLPNASDTPEDLIGLGNGWPQLPAQVVDAFRAFARDRANRPVATALAGMQLAASQGTARGIGLINAYAKTGTARCSHTPPKEGDGFVVVLYPTGQPRIVFLARQHIATGAQTATLSHPLLLHLI